jgi:acetyl esterase/lipase
VEHGVSYLPPDRKEKADLYFPVKTAKAEHLPAVLVIHGGGWEIGSRGSSREVNIGTTLASHGYVAMSIDYMLSANKHAVWPTNLWDCKTAVRWLRKNADTLGIDPNRIGVIGGSAGGQLASMVALTTSKDGLDPAEPYGDYSYAVRCCVDMYGVVDVAAFQRYVNMLGKSAADAPELYRQASPLTYVHSNSPPFLILHGTADKIVNLEQSRRFAAALQNVGVAHELVVIPDAPHTFELQLKQRDLRPVVISFFDKYLKQQTHH